MTDIPEKYLNNNVKAMISGGKSDETIGISQETKTYDFHFFKVFQFFRKKYRVEILLSKED
jgi:hypothetical protein